MQVSQMKRTISQEQWKQRIVECRNSGVPVKEWCREQGISYSTYYRHEQALLKSAQDPSGMPISEQTLQHYQSHLWTSLKCAKQPPNPIQIAL